MLFVNMQIAGDVTCYNVTTKFHYIHLLISNQKNLGYIIRCIRDSYLFRLLQNDNYLSWHRATQPVVLCLLYLWTGWYHLGDFPVELHAQELAYILFLHNHFEPHFSTNTE